MSLLKLHKLVFQADNEGLGPGSEDKESLEGFMDTQELV